MTRPPFNPDDIDPADVPPIGAPLPDNPDNIDPADVPDVEPFDPYAGDDPLATYTGVPSRETPASWLDIPGVAGMLGGVVFLVGSFAIYAVVSLLTHGRIEW